MKSVTPNLWCSAARFGKQWSRRDVLRVGALAPLGLGLAAWLRLLQTGANSAAGFARCASGAEPGRAPVSCILIWLDGGPSHLDTFDLKPDAPREVRGPFQPIATRVPGIGVCEHLPRTAAVMDRVAVVRSMTSTLGEHNFGSQYLLTGYKPSPALVYPAVGSVVAQLRERTGALPSYVAVPDYNPAAGEGFLPASCRPFAVGGDPAKADFRVQDLELYPAVTSQRLQRRRDYLASLDDFSRHVDEASRGHQPPALADASAFEGDNKSALPLDAEFEQAYRLVTSPEARRAFNLAAEPAEVRERYGPRTIGQSCLLARRLVEAGVPFVTVTDRGWDTHDSLYNRLKEGYTGGNVGKVPSLDLAYSALLEDLHSRGLLDSTLVLLMGEFGRTPKLNTAGGRDHWPRVFSTALAGGGIAGGQALGSSDTRGESPAERPVTPADLAATIYTLLGIDPETTLTTSDGRPVRVSAGETVRELIA